MLHGQVAHATDTQPPRRAYNIVMNEPTTLSRREFFAAVATISSGLWLGGLVMLFMSVSSIFKTFDADHTTAGLAATGIFHRFETYQIILARS